MALFAGPVFPEWYWGPIFFAILFGPVLLAAAFGADLLVRRRVRLEWPRRVGLWVGVIACGTLLILGGRALIDDVRFDREASAAARNLDFTPYAPEPLPPPFREEYANADDNFGGPALITRYGAGPGAYATAFQQRPTGEITLESGRCSLRRLAGTGTNFFDGPCRELRTPRGLAVFIGASERLADGSDAFALLDGTLVRLEASQVADRDVLAYFDSLRPVDRDELEFKRG
jgi:hypothetical protein